LVVMFGKKSKIGKASKIKVNSNYLT
jgi:hypothetical protein